ncbi:MAG: Gfo/Idh/MocA family oxidoreductase [Bacteroidales bacterium]|nr:Gfo/Idh/MocA family oxidoreductase [Bacteroidales bacterium]
MKKSRRSFLKESMTLSAGIGLTGLIPSGMLLNSCRRKWGPNDKVRIALIGCRNMGYTDVTNFLRQSDVELAALCDVDQNILEKRAGDIENFAFKNKLSIPKPDLVNDFRKVLDRKDVDAVIIATPDHWHALIMIMACQAGKDVYVEKPLANSIYEADQMVKAARRYHRVVQVGQWQRSGPHWKEMVDFIHSGELGEIGLVDVWRYGGNSVPKVPDSDPPPGVDYNFWLGPAKKRPFNKNRFHYNFRWFWDYAGGKMTDWGVHLIDMGLWALDIDHPQTISSAGGNLVYPDDAMETPDTLTVDYRFNQLKMIWKNNFGVQTNEYGMDHGLIFHGTNGLLLASRRSWKIIPKQVKGGPAMPEEADHPASGQDLAFHIRNFLDSVKSRNYKTACSPDIARNVARIAHMGNISYRTGEKIHWDSETGVFNESQANNLLKPSYRQPWKLPSF